MGKKTYLTRAGIWKTQDGRSIVSYFAMPWIASNLGRESTLSLDT